MTYSERKNRNAHLVSRMATAAAGVFCGLLAYASGADGITHAWPAATLTIAAIAALFPFIVAWQYGSNPYRPARPILNGLIWISATIALTALAIGIFNPDALAEALNAAAAAAPIVATRKGFPTPLAYGIYGAPDERANTEDHPDPVKLESGEILQGNIGYTVSETLRRIAEIFQAHELPTYARKVRDYADDVDADPTGDFADELLECAIDSLNRTICPEGHTVRFHPDDPGTLIVWPDPTPDIETLNHGSIVSIHAETEAGKAWTNENISHAQRLGQAYIVECRFAEPIFAGMAEAGLILKHGIG